MRWRKVSLFRPPVARQKAFGFQERRTRRDRWFKAVIAALTILVAAGLVAGTSAGQYVARRVASRTKWIALRSMGLTPERTEIEADRRIKRYRDIATTRPVFAEIYREADPKMRGLLDALGMDPERALLRWGNYHLTLILPSAVFEPDERRSYRMRPNQRAVWLKPIALPRGLSGFFLAPDRPDLPKLIEGTGAYIVPGSLQTTNSWGCRGPEPDPTAPLRGLILGDSNVQGLFIGDDETPPECLRRELERNLKTRVSILNTGHLGYSPEQYFHTLEEYADRFKPHFIVMSFCANDFGDGGAAFHGLGDWSEGAHWIGEIRHFCMVRNMLCIFNAIPSESQVTALRLDGHFPGQVTNATLFSSFHYSYPIEDFIDEHLRLTNDGQRRGGPTSTSPLYNVQLGDLHFSPKGAEVWGRALGRRLTLLIERAQILANQPQRHKATKK